MVLSAGSLASADGIVLEANDFLLVNAADRAKPSRSRGCRRLFPNAEPWGERSTAVYGDQRWQRNCAGAHGADKTAFGQAVVNRSCRSHRRPSSSAASGTLGTCCHVGDGDHCFGDQHLPRQTFLDLLLFTLALAVGLTPELLPAIISITLSHGPEDGQNAA